VIIKFVAKLVGITLLNSDERHGTVTKFSVTDEENIYDL
tara:strand:+ start:16 stop:132 length:117 start_codon:yes stop_codon:yes gene_type:complete